MYKRILVLLGGILLVLVLGVALASGWLWYQHRQVVTLPAPTGPFHVGRVIFDWTDSARLETLAPTDAQRELMADVWYPTDAATGETADYMPPVWRAAREADYGIGGLFLTQDLAAIRTNSFANAPLSHAQATYPIIVFLPGLGPLASDYTALAEELASHGYIVAAPTPTYSASVVVFDDGRIALRTPAGNVDDNATYAEAQQTLNELIKIWADDAVFVLDQLTALNDKDPAQRFTAHLDLAHVGIAGHSFGGATAAEVLTRDTRFRAGANLDGYFYGTAPAKGFSRPFLTLWSESDATNPDVQQAAQDAKALYSKLPREDAYQYTILGARHFNFTDMALEYAPVFQLVGGLGTIHGERGIAIARAYLDAFMGKYLGGTDAPLLAKNATTFPEIRKIAP